VGTNEAQLPFPSVKLHETQEAISGRVALASFALADVLFPFDSNQDMAWALWFQDDKSCLERLVVELQASYLFEKRLGVETFSSAKSRG
jgi:hypothetical protein